MENLPATINVEGFSEIMQQAPAVLQRNETAVSKCNAVGQALIDTIEAAGGAITSDEFDADVSKYIERVKATVKEMNERRKPLTQLLQSVTKTFTTLESAIDLKTPESIPAKLQSARDRYAAKKIAEQRAREAEARKLQLLENEKATYRSDISTMLENAYTTFVGTQIRFLQGLYDRVTLQDYDNALKLIREEKAEFKWSYFCEGVKDNFTTNLMSGQTRDEIKKEVANQKKEEFTNRYNFEVSELVKDLLDRMPSKKKALEEEEELKKTSAVLAAKAEAERKQKEEEERRQKEEERKRLEEAARVKAEVERQAAEAAAAFGLLQAAAGDPVKAKVKKVIEVKHPKGFLEIYQLWMMKEGINLPIDELEKVHKKMITFCEKEANKDDGEMIKSAYIKYVDDIKAK